MREPWRTILTAILTALLTILGGGTALYVGGCRLPQPPCPDPKPEPKPDPKPEPKPEPKPDPWNAISKVVMSGGYCSGTIVGPRRPDGRWHLVSAAHCFKRTGEPVQVLTRDGRSLQASVSAINRQADCAILVTEHYDDLPFALVAEVVPAVGTQVWHGGFGFDKPGNKETGVLLAGEDANGQLRYRLSVSNGDSGGGIIADANGKLLSPVCCTTRIAGVGDVWGASPTVIRRMLANPTDFLDVKPIEMPVRPANAFDGP